MLFHRNLSDSKSPQVSRTLLSILAVLNNVCEAENHKADQLEGGSDTLLISAHIILIITYFDA